jgi:hypothetical protein
MILTGENRKYWDRNWWNDTDRGKQEVLGQKLVE